MGSPTKLHGTVKGLGGMYNLGIHGRGSRLLELGSLGGLLISRIVELNILFSRPVFQAIMGGTTD